MRYLILVAALLASGCTTTQQKWATIGAGILITGAVIAHQQDSGQPMTEPTLGKRGPFNPCPSGNTQSCK